MEALTPARGPAGRGRRAVDLVGGVLLLAALDANDALVRRARPTGSAWWDASAHGWVAPLEAQVGTIRGEVERFLAQRAAPATTLVNGLDGGRGPSSVPPSDGTWRVVVLSSFGRPVPGNAERFPATMAAVARTPAIANVGFSILDPGSRIEEHRDPNRGALRYQLPVIVPGPPGACRISVGGEERAWEEGRSVLFDLAEPHWARNDTDQPRVVLVMEVLMPLRGPVALVNRAVQRAYRRLPTYRALPERADRLAREAPARHEGER
ncbi:aspartyl/asparaginyl beta-hydroxylase domain-containing protein [Iamia majanohamensis]|uniref:Aspartyl/asparaginyl beta-hydroxylase domain-containing protein n=1 Tax=Iamia majanohamensis TaxID=467976 RepID=A0AAE9Y7J9_9ACTN|nr:aspartyl/asparaginyl beta-hydroxylase domain-containing protein [Iamia majanohamensis]WCO65883.1 aspartyl/asparaginyl beta-hydroxylase domain-containing protein [Iamia majanohamensis]